jgi:hypothetical protein
MMERWVSYKIDNIWDAYPREGSGSPPDTTSSSLSVNLTSRSCVVISLLPIPLTLIHALTLYVADISEGVGGARSNMPQVMLRQFGFAVFNLRSV